MSVWSLALIRPHPHPAGIRSVENFAFLERVTQFFLFFFSNRTKLGRFAQLDIFTGPFAETKVFSLRPPRTPLTSRYPLDDDSIYVDGPGIRPIVVRDRCFSVRFHAPKNSEDTAWGYQFDVIVLR